MRIFTALVKKDLKGYFDQPTGYILLVVFLGVISFLFFRSLDTTREASLRPLFEVMQLPWILPVFVAAASMRLVAEEQRDGTLEILLTQPLRGWSVLLAKFVSGFLFVGVGILFTVVIPIALSTAGDLDSGAIVAQYIGTFFLTASFVAIGVFSSSLTQNQIVSFMVGLALMVALMLAGSPLITLALPPGIAALILDLSPATHYSSMLRGLIDLRDVLYFIALISAFLSGSYLLIRSKSISHRSPLYRNLQLGVAGLVVISLLVGWFGGIIEGRLDLTEKRLYTFSPATKEILGSLDDLLTIKFFYTEELPPEAKLVRRDLEDFLDAVQEQGEGKIRVLHRKTNPEDEDSVREAQENLIRPIQFNTQSEGKIQIEVGYLGLGMTYINQREVIAVVRTTDGMEFAIASAVFRMLQKDPQTIAFHTNSEDPALRFEEGGEPDFRTIRTALTAQVQVEESREGREGQMQMGGIDALVVTGPMRQLPELTLTEWDTYFAEGGEAVFLVDPVITDTQNFRGIPNQFNLDRFLAQYGVRVNRDMVFDTRSHESLTVPDIFQPIIVPYPYWVRIPQADARVSGGVTSAVFPWASSVDLIDPTEPSVQVEDVVTLIETTGYAASDAFYDNLFPQAPHLEDVAEEQLEAKTLAVAITGTRCLPGESECERDPSKRFRIIVAGDSDWINEGWAAQGPGHIEMMSNWVDWLTQDDALAAIRAKGRTVRTLLYDSETQRLLVRYGSMAGVPALFVLLGLVRFFMRRSMKRKTYTSEE